MVNEDLANRPQTCIGVAAALMLGKLGGELSKGNYLPNKGTVTVAFTKGAFAGLSLEMGTLETVRNKANEAFYGTQGKSSEILFQKDFVIVPEESLIPN